MVQLRPFPNPRPSLLILVMIIGAAFVALPYVRAGEPAGDAIVILNCVGILPSTTDCVTEALGPFETLVYDFNNNTLYDTGEALVGPAPTVGAPLRDDPNIAYRDNGNDTTWTSGDPIFYDQDGDPATTEDRIFLLGTPTQLTTLIRDDSLIRFADINANNKLEGVVMVTARLERAGGTRTDETREDLDGIQVVFTYNQTVLQVMRVSPSGSILPDRSQYTKAVRDYCGDTRGSPTDTVTANELAGRISSNHLCFQAPTRTADVGIGCDPTMVTGCPGDGFGLPLQDVDAVRVQFLVLARSKFTLSQIVAVPGVSGTELFDVDGSTSRPVPVDVQGAFFDNRRATNEPPTAAFTFSPQKGMAGQPVNFDGRTSSDPDGTIIRYDWDFGDDETATGPTVTHTYTSPGNYSVKLTVFDDQSSTSFTSRTVEVNPRENLLPVASFTYSPSKATVGQPVSFNAQNSFDPDGGMLEYMWNFGDDVTGTGRTTTHTYTTIGTFVVTLNVTDDEGSSATETHMVPVNTSNQAPTATFTFTPASIPVGGSVNFDGRGSTDPDGTIVSYSWNFGDDTTGAGETVSHTYNIIAVITVTLTVKDNNGASHSFSRAFTVLGITLTIRVQDSESNPISGANVTITSTPTGQTVPPSKTTGTDGTAIFVSLLPGAYTYTVTATDYDPATETVTVQPGTPATQDTVNLSSAEQAPPAPIDYTLYAGIAAALVLIVLGVFLYLRRRKTVAPQSTSV